MTTTTKHKIMPAKMITKLADRLDETGIKYLGFVDGFFAGVETVLALRCECGERIDMTYNNFVSRRRNCKHCTFTRKAYFYIMAVDGYIKIGITTDVKNRAANLGGVVLYTRELDNLDAARELEQSILTQFAMYRCETDFSTECFPDFVADMLIDFLDS